MEHEAVLPDKDGHHQDTHAEHIVGFVPGQAVGEQDGLEQNGDVHEVAEVEHEQVVIGGDILEVSVGQEASDQHQVEGSEVLRVSEGQQLGHHNAGHPECEAHLVHELDLWHLLHVVPHLKYISFLY